MLCYVPGSPVLPKIADNRACLASLCCIENVVCTMSSRNNFVHEHLLTYLGILLLCQICYFVNFINLPFMFSDMLRKLIA